MCFARKDELFGSVRRDWITYLWWGMTHIRRRGGGLVANHDTIAMRKKNTDKDKNWGASDINWIIG